MNADNLARIETRVSPPAARREVPPSLSVHFAFHRPRAQGKFLYVGDEKFWVRGVTYGTFRPGPDGADYPDRDIVESDFAQMAASGLNAVRTYTVPPRWLLDVAQSHGLRVMVGLPWEQHIAFLDDRARARSIEQRVRAGVAACANHPAVLCYAVGNEIPAPIVRWHGARKVERFIERLYRTAKGEDPTALVTYVNYPTTEYLQLPFLDIVCFNVYLESQERLDAYLARLHNLAGDRPVMMGEIGLDSRRNGEQAQAKALDWQVRSAFASGCAGAFLFAWTDEWYRGGFDIADWDFGLTDRERRPKAALAAVRDAFAEAPFPQDQRWPRISVVVCSLNGARTIRDTMEGLSRLNYPNYEVIVVDDGSTDATAAIAREYPVRVISTQNRGLSSARNTGLELASGEIVAYTDDDAYPDPDWLTYLAAAFMRSRHVGVGGPNIAPPGDGWIADCVANAPGGPVHVLLSDQEAEHIPGCNMAFRRDALLAIGGFDPQYRAAGDDVDVCWRLQERGWTLGFSPAAMVWHHRRNSVRMYWKQQQGYGKAEALLEKKWPEKYNGAGHVTWGGQLYGKGLTSALALGRGRIYQGTWGAALFQSVYQPAPGTLLSLPLMPEWYLLIGLLGMLSLLGVLWQPLLLAVPLLLVAAGACVAQALRSAARAAFTSAPRGLLEYLKLFGVTAFLHLLQPLARLRGRLRHGLTLWRRRGISRLAWPWPRTFTLWHERWNSAIDRLHAVEAQLRAGGAVVLRGGDYDHWDLEVRGGLLSAARLAMTIEEHGAGRQMVCLRTWPRCSPAALAAAVLFAALTAGAAYDGAWMACAALAAFTAGMVARMLQECAVATGSVADGIETLAAGAEA